MVTWKDIGIFLAKVIGVFLVIMLWILGLMYPFWLVHDDFPRTITVAAFGAIGVVLLCVLFAFGSIYVARRMDTIETRFSRRDDTRRSKLDERLEHLERLMSNLIVTEEVKDMHHRDTVTKATMSTVLKSEATSTTTTRPNADPPSEDAGG